MKYISRLIILFFIVIFSGNAGVSQTHKNIDLRSKEKIVIDGKKYYLHTVKKGDTEYSLCRIYNVFQSEFYDANPEIVAGLKIDQKIKIPIIEGRNDENPEESENNKYIYHEILKNQTLYFLHEKYDISIQKIIELNPEISSNIIEGQIIKILNPDYKEDTGTHKKSFISGIQSDGNFIYYKVEKNNTLYSLSRKFFLSQDTIIFHNPEAKTVLKIGQILKLPKNSKNSDLEGNINLDTVLTENIEIFKIPKKPESVKKSDKHLQIEKQELKNDTNKFFCFEIAKGETLYSISKKYDVEQDTIIKYNSFAEFSFQTGQIICLPKKIIKEQAANLPIEDDEYIYHYVKWDQTLESISKLYDLKEKKITKCNKDIDFKNLSIGQKIRIPKKYIKNDTLLFSLEKSYSDSLINTDTIQKIETPELTFCDSIDFTSEQKTLNVALMLPFYLQINDTLGLSDTIIIQEYIKNGMSMDSIDILMKKNERIYSKSTIFLEFYEGLLLAIDSLRNTGLNINLSVFDTQKDTIIVKQIVRSKVLDTMDFIIGPVYSINLKIVSEYSKNNGIKLISPLVSNNEFLAGNSNFFQIVPSLEVQLQLFCEQLTAYKNYNILMIYSGDKKDLPLLNLYKKNLIASMKKVTDLDSLNYKQISYNEKNITEIDRNNDPNDIKINIIEEALCKDTANLIILPSIRQGFVSNLIRQINTIYENNKDSLDITLCGFPHWQRYENIELDYLYNLKLLSFTTSYIDYDKKHTNIFIENYRKNYHTEPSKFAFQAYDIMFYFLNNTHKYDNYFIDCISSQANSREISLQSNFNFTKINIDGGYENSSIFLLKYNSDFSFEKPKLISKINSSFNVNEKE